LPKSNKKPQGEGSNNRFRKSRTCENVYSRGKAVTRESSTQRPVKNGGRQREGTRKKEKQRTHREWSGGGGGRDTYYSHLTRGKGKKKKANA